MEVHKHPNSKLRQNICFIYLYKVRLKYLIFAMDQQNKYRAQYPSLITSLYAAWDQNKIPAIFYHYTLSILSKLGNKDQIMLMKREIKQLTTNSHPYFVISYALQARQKSLQLIKNNISVLRKDQNIQSINWSTQSREIQSNGYNIIYQSKDLAKQESKSLIELINHLKMYQKVTYQVIVSIYNWQLSLYSAGYVGPIQFLYRHQDYLQRILKDTQEVVKEYEFFFENNPFLIFKRDLEHTQYGLIYNNVKFSPEFARKIQQALQIIANHDTSIERQRILGKFKQFGTRTMVIKSESLHKIYCNYNNNKNYSLIKNPSIKSQKIDTKQQNHQYYRGILINPEVIPVKFAQKRHPVYIKYMPTDDKLGKSESLNSLNGINVQKVNQRQSLVLTPQPDPTHLHGKIQQKQFQLYDNLNKTIKYKISDIKKKILPQFADPDIQTRQQHKNIEQIHNQEPTVCDINFCYDSDISPYEIIKYVRDTVFNQQLTTLKDIEEITKHIISQKDYITLVRVMAGQSIAAWMIIKFITKDLTIRRAIDILYIRKFMKIPDFEQKILEQFVRKGYGIIKDKGRIMHQIQLAQRISHQLLKIKYKVNTNCERQQIKENIKKHEVLKESRILKYYYYSKQSKYHRFCNHTDNFCQIGYEFEQVFKINISGKTYLRARCDIISKVENCYRVQNNINNTDLIIGKQLEDIFGYSKIDEIDMNSSFQQQQSQKYTFLCLPQSKIMHKYVNLVDKSIIVEYLTVDGNISEILSIATQKKQLKGYLIIQKPFIVAIVCNTKQDFGKPLSILRFD